MKKLCMILLLSWILCFVFSCQDKEAMAELEAFKAQAAVEEQNIALVKRFLAEVDKKNLDNLDELCDPNYKFYFPTRTNPVGLQEHKQLLQSVDIGFPDYKHTLVQFIAQGDSVALRYIWEGTHQGDFSGIPPTGKKIEMGMIAIWRFSEGKVVEYWGEADMLGLYQQLGMEMKLRPKVREE